MYKKDVSRVSKNVYRTRMYQEGVKEKIENEMILLRYQKRIYQKHQRNYIESIEEKCIESECIKGIKRCDLPLNDLGLACFRRDVMMMILRDDDSRERLVLDCSFDTRESIVRSLFLPTRRTSCCCYSSDASSYSSTFV